MPLITNRPLWNQIRVSALPGFTFIYFWSQEPDKDPGLWSGVKIFRVKPHQSGVCGVSSDCLRLKTKSLSDLQTHVFLRGKLNLGTQTKAWSSRHPYWGRVSGPGAITTVHHGVYLFVCVNSNRGEGILIQHFSVYIISKAENCTILTSVLRVSYKTHDQLARLPQWIPLVSESHPPVLCCVQFHFCSHLSDCTFLVERIETLLISNGVSERNLFLLCLALAWN